MRKMYSLWLVPTGQTARQYVAHIKAISQQYHRPYFLPHVTLLGLIKGEEKTIISQTRQLARSLSPLHLQFKEIALGDQYFKAVFGRIKKHPTLVAAHRLAVTVFQSKNAGTYDPHLSFVYGRFDHRTSLTIKKTLLPLATQSFNLVRLDLYLTNSQRPVDWRRIRCFKLKKDRSG